MTETQQKNLKITKAIVQKVVKTVKPGLSEGIGEQKPGHMCVEAAICFALGLLHGDDPKCVGEAVRNIKIGLNDHYGWDSNKARAKGLLKVAVSQLGSNKINQKKFLERLMLRTVRTYLPKHLANGDLPDMVQKAILDSIANANNPDAMAKILAEWREAGIEEDGLLAMALACLRSQDIESVVLVVAGAEDSANNAALVETAELVNQTLIELKSPGAKWLWLAK